MALIAKAIMEPTSGTVAGRMSVSVVLANFPNFVSSHLVRVIHIFCLQENRGMDRDRHRERAICSFTQDGRQTEKLLQ